MPLEEIQLVHGTRLRPHARASSRWPRSYGGNSCLVESKYQAWRPEPESGNPLPAEVKCWSSPTGIHGGPAPRPMGDRLLQTDTCNPVQSTGPNLTSLRG